MLQELLDAIFQTLAFALIPFIVYLIQKKKVSGFFRYLGLYRSNAKANFYAVLMSLVFLLPAVILFHLSPNFREVLHNPQSLTGRFHEMGFGFESMGILFIASVLKTSFTEELFFRGFVAKRLIAWLGFGKGNIIQALIFGGIHILIFLQYEHRLGISDLHLPLLWSGRVAFSLPQ